MNIVEAINEMKTKKRQVARAGWRSVEPYAPFLFFQAHKVLSTNETPLDRIFANDLFVLQSEVILRRDIDGKIRPYQPTQEDIMAEDWEVREVKALPTHLHNDAAVNQGFIFKNNEGMKK